MNTPFIYDADSQMAHLVEKREDDGWYYTCCGLVVPDVGQEMPDDVEDHCAACMDECDMAAS